MAEEEVVVEETLEETYLQKISDLKEKLDEAVDPAEHEKLKAEHKKLLDDYVNKRQAPKKEEKVLRPVIEIAKELQGIKSGDMSNRDYIKKSLEYREAHIKEFGTDPWTNFSSEGSDKETAETKKVAAALQAIVDENESPVEFRMKMNSVLKDDTTLIRKLNKRK